MKNWTEAVRGFESHLPKPDINWLAGVALGVPEVCLGEKERNSASLRLIEISERRELTRATRSVNEQLHGINKVRTMVLGESYVFRQVMLARKVETQCLVLPPTSFAHFGRRLVVR